MRKSNKILIRTVAILLILVLITGCMVSGTFAKYAIKKVGGVALEFEEFGVTVGMELSDELKAAIGSDYEGQTDYKSVTLTLNNLKLKPGDEFIDAVKFTVTGTPSVDVDVIFLLQFSISQTDFTIYKTDFPAIKFPTDDGKEVESQVFVPIGHTVGYLAAGGSYENKYFLSPYSKYGGGTTAGLICDKLTDRTDLKFGNYNGYCVWKDFEAGEPIVFHPYEYEIVNSQLKLGDLDENVNINYFDFGFGWPADYSTSDYSMEEIDAISTWIATYNQPTITLKYTVIVEQYVSTD